MNRNDVELYILKKALGAGFTVVYASTMDEVYDVIYQILAKQADGSEIQEPLTEAEFDIVSAKIIAFQSANLAITATKDVIDADGIDSTLITLTTSDTDVTVTVFDSEGFYTPPTLIPVVANEIVVDLSVLEAGKYLVLFEEENTDLSEAYEIEAV